MTTQPEEPSKTPQPTPAATPPGRRLPTRWFPLTLTVVLALDLATKSLVFSWWSRAEPGTELPAMIRPAFNPGVAWSMFAEMPWLVTGLTLVLIPIICWWYLRAVAGSSRWEDLAFGGIIGGALGNAWDRLWSWFDPAIHGVRDFIHVDLNVVGIPYVWPTFNIADSAICIGAVILVIASWRRPDPSRPALARAGGEAPPSST
jgi:signal peptidase II